MGGAFNESDNGGQYLEVLDDAGRILARLYPHKIPKTTDDHRVTGNTADLVRLSEETENLFRSTTLPRFQRLTMDELTPQDIGELRGKEMLKFKALTIAGREGRITFTYGDKPPAVTNVFDPAAN